MRIALGVPSAPLAHQPNRHPTSVTAAITAAYVSIAEISVGRQYSESRLVVIFRLNEPITVCVMSRVILPMISE
jgi:hypothetical protein